MTLSLFLLAACGGGGGGSNGNGGGNDPDGNTPPANRAPSIISSAFQLDQGADLSATLAATDPEGDAITFSKRTDPASGQILAFAANGAFTYRPNAGFVGADRFVVSASDGRNQVEATVTIDVAAITPPVANDDIVQISAVSPIVEVLANDTDAEGGALIVTIDNAPTTGAALVIDGKVQLTLPEGFKGFTRFTYHLTDATGLNSGSATAAVFVDTAPVRLVYQSDQDNGVQNLFVDDLTGPVRVSNLVPDSIRSFARGDVSRNGQTLVWEEDSLAAVPAGSNDGQGRVLWVIPADLSSAARQVSPTLQEGEGLRVLSKISPDGQWIVYGVTSVDGVETLFLANLLPGGASTPIPLPDSASRIVSDSEQTLVLFGAHSQFVYLSAEFSFGAAPGQATYRIPVADPGAAVRLSSEPAANVLRTIRLISKDESLVVQLSRNVATSTTSIERIDTATPGTQTLLFSSGAGEPILEVQGAEDLVRIAFLTVRLGTAELYIADTAPGGSRRLLTDFVTRDTPKIHDIVTDGVIYSEQLPAEEPVFETALVGGFREREILSNAPGAPRQHRYVDDFASIASLSQPIGTSALDAPLGIVIAPRANLTSREIVFDRATAFFEFAEDSGLVAAITDASDSAPFQLFLANRGGASSPLQITGLATPGSRTSFVRIAPTGN